MPIGDGADKHRRACRAALLAADDGGDGSEGGRRRVGNIGHREIDGSAGPFCVRHHIVRTDGDIRPGTSGGRAAGNRDGRVCQRTARPIGRRCKGHLTTVDRFGREEASHRHAQRVGKGRADRNALVVAANNSQRKALRLEGANVNITTIAGSAALVISWDIGPGGAGGEGGRTGEEWESLSGAAVVA